VEKTLVVAVIMQLTGQTDKILPYPQKQRAAGLTRQDDLDRGGLFVQITDVRIEK
jgi:hypothetical protein